MNVAHGGSLYQDVPAQLPEIHINHSQTNTPQDAHYVDITEGTLLHRLLGAERVSVNSRHHQVVKALGKGLKVNARSEDGLIEGLELDNGYPGIGLQWHPENLSKHDIAMQGLFNWLVREAGKIL